MNGDTSSGDIYYAARNGNYVIKFVGDIRYTMGCSFDQLLGGDLDLGAAGLQRVYIDLQDATSIDSTSLGLLAKVATALRAAGKPKAEVLSGNRDIEELLHSVGFDEIFDIHGSEAAASCPPASQHLQVRDPAKEQMTRTVLEAHDELIKLNDKNREAYQSVVGALSKKN